MTTNNNNTVSTARKIKKYQVEMTVQFAMQNIPTIDRNTLEKFSELITATGNFGPVSEIEIIEKMNLIIRYIPGASVQSLQIVAELLDLQFARSAANEPPHIMMPPMSSRPVANTTRVQ
jgi:hypothetical protein